MQIDDLVFYALIVWTFGLVLVGFGARRGLIFWPAVLHLVFMLPLPQFLYWQVSTALQVVSSEVGVALVRAMGVPVFLEGNIIDLGVYKLQVAEACSGLRYLFPIMSFTYVFAVLYRGPVWHRLVLLLAAVPLAVAMNSLRIGAIGLLVDRFGIGQAEGFLHLFEGWVVFLACIAILFAMAKLMQRLSGDRRPLGTALDLDFTELAAELGRIRGVVPSPALVAAACLTAALALGLALAPERGGAAPARDGFALSRRARRLVRAARRPRPDDRGGARRRRLSDGDYARAGEAAPVDLFLSWYREQTDGSAIHSPAVCLPGAGWEVAAIAPVTVALPGTATGQVRLNRAVIRKGSRPSSSTIGSPAAAGSSPTTSPPSSTRDGRQPALRPHRRRAGAGDHAGRRRRRGRGRRPARALPRRDRRPPATLHPGLRLVDQGCALDPCWLTERRVWTSTCVGAIMYTCQHRIGRCQRARP